MMNTKDNCIDKKRNPTGMAFAGLLLLVCLTLSFFLCVGANGGLAIKAEAGGGLIEAVLEYEYLDEDGGYYTVTGYDNDFFTDYKGLDEWGLFPLSIEIPEYGPDGIHPVTKIADQAFDPSNLFPLNNVFRIHEADFSKAVNLETIGEWAFALNDMGTVDLSKCANLNEIGWRAFYNSSMLKEVYLPGHTSLKLCDDVFWHCYSLHTVYFGNPDEPFLDPALDYYLDIDHDDIKIEIGEDIFADCYDLEFIIFDCMTLYDAYDDYVWGGGVPFAEYKYLFTFEVKVSFVDNDSKVLSPPELKLAGKDFYYVKRGGVWVRDTDYTFPSVERAYRKTGEWYMGWWEANLTDTLPFYPETTKLTWDEVEFNGVAINDGMEPPDISVFAYFDKNGYIDTEAYTAWLETHIKENNLIEFCPSWDAGYGAMYMLSVDFYTIEFTGETLKSGENVFRAVLDGLYDEFIVNITPVKPETLTSAAPPTRFAYAAYQTFDATGLSLSCAFNDGSQTAVTDFDVTYQNGSSFRKGDTHVIVSYTLSGKTASLNIPVTVVKAVYDMNGVTFDDMTVYYDGSPKSLAVTGALPEGVAVFYNISDRTAVGEYTVTAMFTISDPDNYEPVAPMTATLTIVKKPFPAGVIAGIVAGGAVALAGAGFCAYWFYFRKKRLALATANGVAVPTDMGYLSADEV